MTKRNYFLMALLSIVVFAVAAFAYIQVVPSTDDKAMPGNAREISIDTVKKHNQPNDCWAVVGVKVYNLTTLINSNPNDSTFRYVCGTNATEALGADIASDNTKKLFNKIEPYYIGIVAP